MDAKSLDIQTYFGMAPSPYHNWDILTQKVCFVVVVVNLVVVLVLIIVAVHKGLVVVDKSLSDTH